MMTLRNSLFQDLRAGVSSNLILSEIVCVLDNSSFDASTTIATEMPKPRPSRDLEVFDADDWPVPKADDTASATKPRASRDDEVHDAFERQTCNVLLTFVCLVPQVFGEPDSSKVSATHERTPSHLLLIRRRTPVRMKRFRRDALEQILATWRCLAQQRISRNPFPLRSRRLIRLALRATQRFSAELTYLRSPCDLRRSKRCICMCT